MMMMIMKMMMMIMKMMMMMMMMMMVTGHCGSHKRHTCLCTTPKGPSSHRMHVTQARPTHRHVNEA